MRVTRPYGENHGNDLNEECVRLDLNEKALLIGEEGQDIARDDSTGPKKCS